MDLTTLEEYFVEFGVKIGFLTPEKAEQLLKEHPQIVRCKDCEHRFNGCCYNKKSDRINFGVYVADNWFCADGTKKVGETK